MPGKVAVLLVVFASLAFPLSGGVAGYDAGKVPPGEAGAKVALESSPRHHEWVDIAVPNRDTKVAAFVAYPERKDKAPVVVVIHEIYGLTDWIRAPCWRENPARWR